MPYLDLVGAGMMVTASCPVYEDDRLLAVVSHDITLKELTKSVSRASLAMEPASCLLPLMAWPLMPPTRSSPRRSIGSTPGGVAVLYYRTAEG